MLKRVLPFVLCVVLVLTLAACSPAEEPVAPEAPAAAPEEPAPAPEEPAAVEEPAAPALSGDSLRGGLLYDKWWTPLGLDAPEEDQALWATQDTNTRSGADTWRCKECHGWDYKGVDGAYGDSSHTTGFVGVIQMAGGDANDVLAAMQGATNADHDFSTVMDEQALIDISLFISEEIMDYAEVIDAEKAAIGGDLGVGEDLYQESCADCHGPEGTAIDFKANVTKTETISAIANGNPWEYYHKMRFGQPTEADMPPAIDAGWSVEEQTSVLAYGQTLPNTNPATQGGLLYDKWWKAMGADEPTGDQPLWATQSTNERSGTDTWRCKECHGWDYRGIEGAYSDSSHTTGFIGSIGAADMSAEEIVGWLDGTSNADHDFSAYMDEAAMDMFVAFFQTNAIDQTLYVNDDKTVNGDVATGQEFYQAGCARCHGDDGQEINFGDDDNPKYLGDVARDNPWETLHKAANGQPAEGMPGGLNLGWSWQDLADTLAYTLTLGE
ncbi:MAG: cytochrome c [Anaerolineae bacterium]|jgi:thiosulfate dehydrogenase|nr:cytochrome c [Anaerolineae bacterium]MBT4309714.1 cytochrome c [Anaerolineae bacterium]MBT4456907.1 cytochrome c [Anaerolineae bacterium]MBT4841210.1 cytochrome c [Anaerolineae bacterium]MBT6062423.1 cytochrome c [Anaerolineae bacterium]